MTEELPLCECGCGERVSKVRNRFIQHHHRIGKKHTIETRSRISEGTKGVSKPPFTQDHCNAISAATKGVPKPPRTPEHCLALSKAKIGVSRTLEACDAISAATTGVPKSPEHIAAMKEAWKLRPPFSNAHISNMSESHKNSEAVKAVADVMRGGLDLVWHHVAYDFNDSNTLRVRIKRKFHGQIHHPSGIPLTIRGYSLID